MGHSDPDDLERQSCGICPVAPVDPCSQKSCRGGAHESAAPPAGIVSDAALQKRAFPHGGQGGGARARRRCRPVTVTSHSALPFPAETVSPCSCRVVVQPRKSPSAPLMPAAFWFSRALPVRTCYRNPSKALMESFFPKVIAWEQLTRL